MKAIIIALAFAAGFCAADEVEFLWYSTFGECRTDLECEIQHGPDMELDRNLPAEQSRLCRADADHCEGA